MHFGPSPIDSSGKIILVIPGNWQSRTDAITSIVDKNNGSYIMAGAVLLKTGADEIGFEAHFIDQDMGLKKLFKNTGGRSFPQDQLSLVMHSKYAICIYGLGGSLENVYHVMDVGRALLDAGGLGIIIINTSAVHAPEVWRAYAEAKDTISALQCVITLTGGMRSYYTCGMHCFGLPDVACARNETNGEYATELLMNFCYYCLNEQPVFKDGDVFSIDARLQLFQVQHGQCAFFKPDDPHFNSYGMYTLCKKRR